MIVFVVMLVSIAAARGIGALGWDVLADWQVATRVGLAVMFVFTGLAHFGRTRTDLIRMVPPWMPRPALVVALTGFAELAGAVGLLVPPLARPTAVALIALLVAMFPANVHATRAGRTLAGRPPTPLALRLPLQALWVGLLWWSTWMVRGEDLIF
jgi:uncharacterized membrane protein